VSRLGLITINWADGEYSFALTIKQLIELQEKCDAGPPHILARLEGRAWHVSDVRETMRLGLIGGGMSPADALKLTMRYVDERPLGENVLIAQVILSAAIVGAPEGVEDAPPGKPEADQPTSPFPEAKSDGPHTSEPD